MPLADLNQTILDGLSEITELQTVSNMPKRRDTITLPAVVVDLAELENGEDPGTGELGLIAHWEARVIAPEKQHELIIWQLVQNVMYWLFNFNWPQENVGRPKLKQAAPDHFSPELQGHRVWLIEWTQDLRVGENIYEELDEFNIERITVHYEDCSEVILGGQS